MSIFVQESSFNATEQYMIGESEVYDTGRENVGDLFRTMQLEYGRCISKVRIDPDEKAVGWVFEQLQRYEDTGEKYLRHMWVTLHTEPPTKTIKCHYMEV